VRDGYLAIAARESGRFCVFSGETPEDELFEKVKDEVMAFLKK
jgi:hypothetical protein